MEVVAGSGHCVLSGMQGLEQRFLEGSHPTSPSPSPSPSQETHPTQVVEVIRQAWVRLLLGLTTRPAILTVLGVCLHRLCAVFLIIPHTFLRARNPRGACSQVLLQVLMGMGMVMVMGMGMGMSEDED